jgi:hypothetical protein
MFEAAHQDAKVTGPVGGVPPALTNAETLKPLADSTVRYGTNGQAALEALVIVYLGLRVALALYDARISSAYRHRYIRVNRELK